MPELPHKLQAISMADAANCTHQNTGAITTVVSALGIDIRQLLTDRDCNNRRTFSI